MRTLLAGTLALIAIAVLAACGGDDDTATTTTSSTGSSAGSGPCSEIEEVDVPPPQHDNREFTAADFDTNPPAGGDHTDAALTAGTFYTDPVNLGEAVHFLEHGAVIGWTNDLSAEDREAVEEAFNEVFKEGYYQVATVENAEMDVPFAVSAWGALQSCDEVDTSVINPFVEEWYASPKSPESALACEGQARLLPPC